MGKKIDTANGFSFKEWQLTLLPVFYLTVNVSSIFCFLSGSLQMCQPCSLSVRRPAWKGHRVLLVNGIATSLCNMHRLLSIGMCKFLLCDFIRPYLNSSDITLSHKSWANLVNFTLLRNYEICIGICIGFVHLHKYQNVHY